MTQAAADPPPAESRADKILAAMKATNCEMMSWLTSALILTEELSRRRDVGLPGRQSARELLGVLQRAADLSRAVEDYTCRRGACARPPSVQDALKD